MYRKGEQVKTQDFLRKQVKHAKAEYDDIFFKDFATYIDITEHAFYNWLHGYYNLSNSKIIKLQEILIDLLDIDLD